ncbi:integrase core domain-containing protein [Leptospira santarosai]|uniref:integrase core domain-containing protein n=1 Tax=Leptospira santarosai TaxID=28183 RepID=UPI0031FDD3AD
MLLVRSAEKEGATVANRVECGLRNTFNDFKEAQSTIKQAVFLYNNVRLHQHLGFLTPEFVHQAS